MVTVYRYNTAHPHIETRDVATHGNEGNISLKYVEWSQCCHMAWLAGVTYSSEKQIASAMVANDNGYVATFFCSVNAQGKRSYDRGQVKLTKLGFKKVVDVPGPYNYNQCHGDDMEIWMYSTVENKSYRKLHEVFAEYGPFKTPLAEPVSDGDEDGNLDDDYDEDEEEED